MVEQLSQTANRGSSGELRTITPAVLFHTGSSSVVGGVALSDPQSGQSTRLTLQASVLLAHQIGTGWRRKRSDKVDAFRCR